MNPAGVPSRVNLGQLLETAAAKVAKKNGKPILVDNFAPINHLAHVQDLLKKNGLTDKETLLDPKTKRPLGEVLVGPQYIFKLKHQVGTKLQARSRDAYDVNKTPQRGGSYGGQSLGALGIYALLAHGARANLREMATYKSDYNDEVWHAIQSGEQLPPPRAPFTQDKFMTYLKGAGINIYKDGNSLTLMPLTDKHVLELSAGQLTQPSMVVRGKDLFPVTGGLFDLKLTGGPDGTSWSHIKLSEPMPNPIFEGAVRSVLGLNTHQFSGLISGELGITKDGTLDPAGTIHGGAAFEHLLKRLDVDKNLAAAKKALETAPVSRVNEINKKVKILSALKSRDLSPTVYLLHNIPVLPPRFRPLTPRPDGTVNEGDLNSLYKNLATINESLPNTPITERTPVRAALYDAMKALSLHGMSIRGKEHKGILSIIAGSQPKTGFFQDKVIKRRQDLTMRSTIVPEPNLGLDEVGLPEEGAWSLYQPFIQRRLRQLGIPPLRSLDEIKDRTPYARAALEHVMNERPVLLKRDPVLHKFSVMAFKPVLHPGKAIKIHPLVTGGFNADFDGDTMSAFVPVTHEAVEEAKKMYPSGSLFSPTTGLLMNRLSSESLLGTYMMSDWGKQTSHVFKTPADAAKAAADGKIGITEVVQIGTMKTTMGRYMLANSFPEEFKLGDKPVRQSLLSDKNFVFDKKTLEKTLTALARSDKYAFAKTVGKMQNLGTEYVYSTGFSIGLSDLAPVIQLRDKILKGADHKVYAMRQGAGSRADKDKAAIQIYDKATLDMEIEAKKHFGGVKNNIYKMVQSGARGNWDQFKQMTVAPMLVRNAKGEIVPVPIKTSYAEGLDTADYWTALHGGREGIIQKVIGTSKPGAFSKIVMSSTIDMLISGHDCGTQHGTLMESEDPQIIGRYLAQPVKIKNEVIKAGSSVTSELVTRLMNNRVGKVVVRSPLRCDMPHGICQVCFGLNEHGHPPSIGTNIGAIAGQAIGEPATQLALKAFHTGGVVGSKTTRRTDAFTRINQLLAMPKIMPNASVLARTAGPISRMDPDPAGGWSVYVGQEKHYVPSTRELITGLKVGSTVKKGQAISDGDIHPVDLLKLTNINAVQEYLTDELFSAYKPVGPVRRNNLEVVVKAITNLARVDDPGDHPDFARGDMTSASKLVTLNRTVLKGRKPIVFQPVLKPIAQLPLEISEDWMARMNYRHLQDTLIEGAQKGWHTLVHQPHPIPGLAMGTEFGKGTKQEPWLY
jgi:DNA-directed RNA polymerase subunit beta'